MSGSEAGTAAATAAVLYEVSDGVATVTLNRPEQRNVLNADSLAPLLAALEHAASDDAVRAEVLTGTGNTFCSGADLRGAASDADGFASSGPRLTASVLEALLDHPKPTIARVQGHVAGGGNGLVAACDLAVAVEDARFAFTEVRVGVAPAVISVVCLRVMRPRDAAELMLTGERVPAARALQAGLLTEVVPAAELDATVGRWCAALRLGGPGAVAATKELLRRVPALSRDEGFAYTSELSARLFGGAEAAEGMSAFVERRPPAWAPPP
ncbi:MAG: enoyl-CoA hydratase/isomerase family protein [Actinomycetes bacterium]